jgi:AraC-like DNA-binding protein
VTQITPRPARSSQNAVRTRQLARLRAQFMKLLASVENEIYRLPPRGRPPLETVAAALGANPRTLVRRLATEGVTFARMIDDLRHELSLQIPKKLELQP